jgi:hypothetical protein
MKKLLIPIIVFVVTSGIIIIAHNPQIRHGAGGKLGDYAGYIGAVIGSALGVIAVALVPAFILYLCVIGFSKEKAVKVFKAFFYGIWGFYIFILLFHWLINI